VRLVLVRCRRPEDEQEMLTPRARDTEYFFARANAGTGLPQTPKVGCRSRTVIPGARRWLISSHGAFHDGWGRCHGATIGAQL
jgi:hypothetical protein